MIDLVRPGKFCIQRKDVDGFWVETTPSNIFLKMQGLAIFFSNYNYLISSGNFLEFALQFLKSLYNS